MVPPEEHDMVLVTGGAGGFEGELVCIDRDDAILKDTTEGFRIFDYIHLAKITSR
jgi:hypothetical protein